MGGVQSLASADGVDRRSCAQVVRGRNLSGKCAGGSRWCGRTCCPAGFRKRAHRGRDPVAAADRQEGVDQMRLERRAAMATLLADRDDNLLLIPGLGSTAWDAAAAGDKNPNFFLFGA